MPSLIVLAVRTYPAKSIRPSSQGRLLVLGLLGGRVGDIDLGKLGKASDSGTVLEVDPSRKISLTQVALYILPMFERNQLVPVVDGVFEMANMELGHSSLVRNHNVGKLIARW